MTRHDIVSALGIFMLVTLISTIICADGVVWSDTQFDMIENVDFCLQNWVWAIGLIALPTTLLIIWLWHRATGRSDS